MREYDEKPKMDIRDILTVLYGDIVETDANIAASTDGGKSPEKVLAYLDQGFARRQSFALLDDIEMYQTPATEGVHVSVDAIYENRQDGSRG